MLLNRFVREINGRGPQLWSVSVVFMGMMRTAAVVTAGMFMALACIWPSSVVASGRTVHVGCVPKYSRLIVADRQAQVFQASYPPGVDEYGDVYGCANGRSHRYHLGAVPTISSTGGSAVAHETLAGPVVAYEESKYGGYESDVRSEAWIFVRDLHTGRLLHKVPTGTAGEPGQVGVGYSTAIVVKRDGAVAWIVDNFGLNVGLPPETVPYFEVKSLDGSGLRTLAEGTDVDPSSLALAGSYLYWTQGDHASSALLH